MRKVIYVGLAAVLAVATLLYVELSQPRGSGRYTLIQAGSDWSNFVWVLDTATGEVAVHRLIQHKDAAGTLQGFAVEHEIQDSDFAQVTDLMSEDREKNREYIRTLLTAQTRRERSYRCRQFGTITRLLLKCSDR